MIKGKKLERKGIRIKKNVIYCATCIGFIASIPDMRQGYLWTNIVMHFVTVAVAYFCFQKLWKDSDIAITCSALYTLSVFRIGMLQIETLRGNIAFALLPIVLYGWYQLLYLDKQDSNYRNTWLWIGLGYGGVAMAHIQTFIVVLIVTGILFLFTIKRVLKKSVIIQIALGILGAGIITNVGVFLCKDYYITEWNVMQEVASQMIQPNGLQLVHLFQHFWGENMYLISEEMGIATYGVIGMGLLLVVAVGVLFIMWYSNLLKQCGEKADFVKVVAILAVVMMLLSLHVFPWDRIQLLMPLAGIIVGGLQYPGRFLGCATLLAVAVIGFELWYLRQENGRVYQISVVVIMASIVTSSMFYLDCIA